MGRALFIGTRGSPLALVQTSIVLELLKRRNSRKDVDFRIRTIKTEGDQLVRRGQEGLTGKDVFTKAIDDSLSEGSVDIAIHSLKDVPEDRSMSPRIMIAAFPKRESPFDVLISKNGKRLQDLKNGARIGTSSLRRALQLKSFRPDFEMIEIHGNVGTRIKKLQDRKKKLDGIVLAEAGLKRLGLEKQITQVLPSRVMMPAVGQGCLAVVVRKEDTFARDIVKAIDHSPTRIAVAAERAFSKEMGGGCNLPMASYARSISKSTILVEGLIQAEERNNGNIVLRSSISGRKEDAKILGSSLAKKLKRIAGR